MKPKKKCCANCAYLKIQDYPIGGKEVTSYLCKKHRDYIGGRSSLMMLALSLYAKIVTELYCDKYKEAK